MLNKCVLKSTFTKFKVAGLIFGLEIKYLCTVSPICAGNNENTFGKMYLLADWDYVCNGFEEN